MTQTRDGLVIVDQHAAHERIVYERLKSAIKQIGVPRQILLIPEIVELDEPDVQRLVARADDLARFGLVLEAFGLGAVALRERRRCSARSTAAGFCAISPNISQRMGRDFAARTPPLQVASSMACHGSVRAGRR